MEIHGVRIGDRYMMNHHCEAEVIAIHEVKDYMTGKHIRFECIAKHSMSVNKFTVPFSTVVRNRTWRGPEPSGAEPTPTNGCWGCFYGLESDEHCCRYGENAK